MDETKLDPEEILAKVYGCSPVRIQQLSGYDDLNFVVEFETFRGERTGGKYVLKIVNEMDSSRTGLTCSIMNVMHSIPPEMKFRFPRPVQCSNGELVGRIENGSSCRNVVLLSFVSGLDHKELHYYEGDSFLKLCEKIGNCGGFLSSYFLSCGKNAEYASILRRNDDEYMAQNVHLGRKKLKIVENEEIRTICSKVMDFVQDFHTKNICNLREGIIHNDLCMENLVFEKNFDDTLDVVGAIDFSDMTFSFYVYEAAIPIASAMYQTYVLKQINPKDAAKAVLRGFESHFSLEKEEKEYLYYAIMARFVSLRVVGGFDVLNSSQTAEHEEHNSESLEYFIKLLWDGSKEKWDKIFCDQ